MHHTRPRVKPTTAALAAAALLAAFLLPSPSHAAWAVYADSWSSKSLAQEQAATINRALSITTATYERVTVQGRVFWRVSVGVCRTSGEAAAIRRRLQAAGFKHTWTRETAEASPAGEAPSPSAPAQAPAPAQAQTRIDSAGAAAIASAALDSVARRTRHVLDSIETASRQQTEESIRRIRSQLSAEVLLRLEQDQARQQTTYVTHDEQTQMTRALLDEMSAEFTALRDSLRRAKAAEDAARPRLFGFVAARASGTHVRPQTGPVATEMAPALSDGRVTVGWGDSRSEVRLTVRASSSSSPRIDAREGYATWRFAGGARIGAGIFEQPYGLEPTQFVGLFAPSPGILTEFREQTITGVWLAPYESPGACVLLLPYGAWDEGRQQGLAQVRFADRRARFELTGIGERYPSGTDREGYAVLADLVASRQGERWYVGMEALGRLRRDGDTPWASVGVRREVRTAGALVLVHFRPSRRWGWTLRGDALVEETRWIGWKFVAVAFRTATPVGSVAPRHRRATATTGPVGYVGDRLRLSLAYTLDVSDERTLSYAHTLRTITHRAEIGISETF